MEYDNETLFVKWLIFNSILHQSIQFQFEEFIRFAYFQWHWRGVGLWCDLVKPATWWKFDIESFSNIWKL